MHVFLTGVTGFCGSHLTSRLLRAGHSVSALCRPDQRGPEELDRSETGHLTLTRGHLLSLSALPSGIDAVVHTAAVSPTPQTTVRDFISTNALGTERLAALAARSGVGKFIFFSSLSIYGEIHDAVVSENTPVRNPDPYGASKLFGEWALREHAASMSAIALRLPGVLGRGASRHWLSTITTRARLGQDLTIFNPDFPFNNAVHVDDLAGLVLQLLGRTWTGFDCVTLGAGDALPVAAVVAKFIDALKSSAKVTIVPALRPSFTISNARAKALYGYNPMTLPVMLNAYLSEIDR